MKRFFALMAVCALMVACNEAPQQDKVEKQVAEYMDSYKAAVVANDLHKAISIQEEIWDWSDTLDTSDLDKASAALEEWMAKEYSAMFEAWGTTFVAARAEAFAAGDYDTVNALDESVSAWFDTLSEGDAEMAEAAVRAADEKWWEENGDDYF
ncbi:MAG: hypothetical protein IJ464_05575 [Alistipes sp.]|nr:hypothetical protein [Alistipes sp.]